MHLTTPRLTLSALISTSLTLSLALPAAQAADPAGEGALSIVAWPGYIERGETDKAYRGGSHCLNNNQQFLSGISA